MPYVPPNGLEADFRLVGGYTPPSGLYADFDLGEVLAEVSQSFELLWVITTEVKTSFLFSWAITQQYVETSVFIDYAITSSWVENSCFLGWQSLIEQGWSIELPYYTDIEKSWKLVWRSAWEIGNSIELIWSDKLEVGQSFILSCANISPVEKSFELLYNLETKNPVGNSWTLISLFSQEGENIEYDWSLQIAGVNLESVFSISLSNSTDQFAISVTINLLDGGEYIRCPIGSLATLFLAGESIALMVVGRNRTRSIDNYIYTIQLSSPSVFLDTPWADTIDGEYSGMAATVAEQVAGSINWNTINWPILPGRFQVSNQTPINALRQIAGAVGAVVVSELDGSVTIQPDYPVPLADWYSVTPGAFIYDASEVFQSDENETSSDIYDSVLIEDGQSASNSGNNLHIKVENDANGDGKKVYVWCYPWNPSITLRHAGGGWVHLNRIGDEIREEIEIVTISSGEGNCTYPVSSVKSIDWKERDLGEVIIDAEGHITAAIQDDSLLEVTYRTKARVWRLRDSRDESVLIIAEANDALSGSTFVSVLVYRGSGENRGPTVQDPLIGSDAAALERGRNILDGACSLRSTVVLVCPLRTLYRPGMVVEVVDLETLPWRGLLRQVDVLFSVNNYELTANYSLTIEREIPV